MPQVPVNRDQFHNLVADTYGEKEFRGEYDANDNMIYAGFALPGTAEGVRSWQIKKLSYDANDNLLTVKWPQINSKASIDYSFSWTDRATYTYS